MAFTRMDVYAELSYTGKARGAHTSRRGVICAPGGLDHCRGVGEGPSRTEAQVDETERCAKRRGQRKDMLEAALSWTVDVCNNRLMRSARQDQEAAARRSHNGRES